MNITREKNKLHINLINSQRELFLSITRTNIIEGSTITDNYKSLSFIGKEIIILSEYNNKMYVSTVLKMCHDLCKQLEYLISSDKCIIGYSKKHVLVIDNEKFIYIPSDNDLLDIIDNNMIISSPFKLSDFYQSPETLSLNSIPSNIHYKSSYYSLGCLIIDILVNNNVNNKEVNNECSSASLLEINEKKLDSLLINGSKIYYFLKRCITRETENRVILYI